MSNEPRFRNVWLAKPLRPVQKPRQPLGPWSRRLDKLNPRNRLGRKGLAFEQAMLAHVGTPTAPERMLIEVAMLFYLRMQMIKARLFIEGDLPPQADHTFLALGNSLSKILRHFDMGAWVENEASPIGDLQHYLALRAPTVTTPPERPERKRLEGPVITLPGRRKRSHHKRPETQAEPNQSRVLLGFLRDGEPDK